MRIMDWSSDVGSSDLVRLRMPGCHNAMNALAAIAAARVVNIPVAQSVAALADFAGLARRYAVLGQAAGVTVIDDFASNPDVGRVSCREKCVSKFRSWWEKEY